MKKCDLAHKSRIILPLYLSRIFEIPKPHYPPVQCDARSHWTFRFYSQSGNIKPFPDRRLLIGSITLTGADI